jgi:hypothetical protein
MRQRSIKLKPIISIILILITQIACGVNMDPHVNTPEPLTETIPHVTDEIGQSTITADVVNIRLMDGTLSGEYALLGMPIYGYPDGDWFVLVSLGREWGKVWRGCTDASVGRGCRAR